MPRVITFGEIMLRLSTPGYLRFGQARQFDATFGGGEAISSRSRACSSSRSMYSVSISLQK